VLLLLLAWGQEFGGPAVLRCQWNLPMLPGSGRFLGVLLTELDSTVVVRTPAWKRSIRRL